MKSCPVCHRNFDDDTLLYCTEDGTPLSAPHRSGEATLLIPSARDTDPPATEILPHGYQPPGAPDSATWPAQTAGAGSEPTQLPPTQFAGRIPPPMNNPPVVPAYHPPVTSAPSGPNRTQWLVVSAVLAVVAVGGIIGIAYLLLRADDSSNKNAQAQLTSSPTPNANRPASNSNTGDSTNANIADNDPSDWLEGEWEGSGTNTDGSTWSVVLIRDFEGTAISYPKLNCTGVWEEKSIDDNTATFTEKIKSGSCDDGTSIKVTRLTENQISVSWIVENSDVPVTSAALNRTRSPQGH
jgi:hypothetical protein